MSSKPLVTAASLQPRGSLITTLAPRRVSQLGPDEEGDPQVQEAKTSAAPAPAATDKPPRRRGRPRLHPPSDETASAEKQKKKKQRVTTKKRKAKKKRASLKPTRRARVAPAETATPADPPRKFAVWNDGSVDIDTAECKGRMSGDDVDLLLAYVQRLRGQ